MRVYLKLATLVLVVSLLGTVAALAQEKLPEPLALDEGMRAAIVDSVLTALDDVYVFPDVAAEMEKLVRRNLDKGKYDDLDNVSKFTERLTKDLQSISHDLHLHTDWMPPTPQRQGQDLSDEEMKERSLNNARRNNFGFKEIKFYPGNVAYIRLDMFADTDIAGPTAIAAMNYVAHADAIIFDLRANGGGSPNMIQLIFSYLMENRTHLNSFYVRKSNVTNQFWTQDFVSGPRMSDAEVYVLTSRNTFSAAEEFSYNMKSLERGTIVGQTTGGGAHPITRVAYPDLQVSLSLPYGRAINPITGTNWEGTGIEPHMIVPVEEAFDVAYMDALKTMEKTADDDEKYGLAWAINGLKAEANSVELSQSEMKPYSGQYGPRRIWIEDGQMWYERESRGKLRMIPMGDGWFMFEEIDYFRIKFDQSNNKEATTLIGHYMGGYQDQNERTGS